MNIAHYIRMIGHHHAMHHHNAVLGVTGNEAAAAASPHTLVHRAAAEELVAKGDAEWIGLAPADPPPRESHRERADRHLTEHGDMLAKHASEHRELMERHAREYEEAIAAAGLAAAITGI